MNPLFLFWQFILAFSVMDDVWFERDRPADAIKADNVIELDDYRHA